MSYDLCFNDKIKLLKDVSFLILVECLKSKKVAENEGENLGFEPTTCKSGCKILKKKNKNKFTNALILLF